MVRKKSSGVFSSIHEDIPLHMPLNNGSHVQSPANAPRMQEEAFDPAKYTKPYMKFMTENPTVFHAVAHFAKELDAAGYEYLAGRKQWNIKPGGKYYTKRNESAFIAFAVGKDYKPGNGVGIVAAHIDALTARLKPVSKLDKVEGYVQLAVAPYAGALGTTWWDRDLGIGGKVLVKNGSKIETKLVKLDWPIARIPTLAPHFGAASLGPFNKETQMVPIIGIDNSDIGDVAPPSIDIEEGTFAATQDPWIVKAITTELGIAPKDLANWELELFDIMPAQLGGINKEFIFAGRIDDKVCCFSAVEGLLASSDSTSTGIIKMVGCFDDEEIGSDLRQGAKSNFMESTITRIVEAVAGDMGPNLKGQTLCNSFLVSSDVTHAVNPNFLSNYLKNHCPRLNVGITVAADANGHMTTDSISSALFHEVADRCGSKLQIFHIRNDGSSGGTIGPMTSTTLGCRAIDCGVAQLSMHSIRATIGSLDPGLAVKMYKGFFDYYEEVDKEFQ